MFTLCSVYASRTWSITSQVTSQSGALVVYFLDIGQGDASLIKTPENNWILIDTGPTSATLFDALEKVAMFPDRIDLLLLTHPHKDHIGALSALLERIPVGAILYNTEADTTEQQAALKIAETHQIPLYPTSATHDIQLGDQTILDILMVPDANDIGDNLNNASILVRLASLGHSFLFAGDAEISLEHTTLLHGIDVAADYLKGGHHGSSTSSSYAFLQAVHPRNVIFSNGKNNSFKHPHEEVLTRLSRMHIPYFNTSSHGTIYYTCFLDTPCEQHLERS